MVCIQISLNHHQANQVIPFQLMRSVFLTSTSTLEINLEGQAVQHLSMLLTKFYKKIVLLFQRIRGQLKYTIHLMKETSRLPEMKLVYFKKSLLTNTLCGSLSTSNNQISINFTCYLETLEKRICIALFLRKNKLCNTRKLGASQNSFFLLSNFVTSTRFATET